MAGSTIDPVLIGDTARKLQSLTEQIEAALGQAKAAVMQLAPDFTGPAGEASRAFFNELDANARRLHESYQSFHVALGTSGIHLGEGIDQVTKTFSSR